MVSIPHHLCRFPVISMVVNGGCAIWPQVDGLLVLEVQALQFCGQVEALFVWGVPKSHFWDLTPLHIYVLGLFGSMIRIWGGAVLERQSPRTSTPHI